MCQPVLLKSYHDNKRHLSIQLEFDLCLYRSNTDSRFLAIRPMGQLMANRKTSSSTSCSESPSHGEHGLVQALLNKWKNITTPLFLQRKNASDEYLRIKERQLKPKQQGLANEEKLKQQGLA
nr:hypothetical protein [Tanacetum cinerariifolium]